MQNKNVVLFACIHNAGRSQMAAAIFNMFANPTKAYAISAGTSPAKSIHTEVINVMREVGIDLSNVIPILLTDELANQASLLITMGCEEKCPVILGVHREDWQIEDPKDKSIDTVKQIYEEIENSVINLLTKYGWIK